MAMGCRGDKITGKSKAVSENRLSVTYTNAILFSDGESKTHPVNAALTTGRKAGYFDRKCLLSKTRIPISSSCPLRLPKPKQN